MKIIRVRCCGECPYLDGWTLRWYCQHPDNIDRDGIGKVIGDNKLETLNSLPDDLCPLESYKGD